MLFAALCALVISIPVGVSLIDTEADDPTKFSIVLWVGWAVCAALAAVVLIHFVGRLVSAPSAGVALAHDALPLLLLIAWALVVPALFTAHWLLAFVAGCLCAIHLVLVVPRFRAVPTPRWVAGAPTFTLCVANVYIDNPTPDDAARALVATGSDLIIIVESTPDFMRHFDAAPGAGEYGQRVADPDDTSDYAVTIATRLDLHEGSGPQHHGELRTMRAVVPVGGADVTVVGINPMATVDRGGYRTWRSQLRQLRRDLSAVHGPLVLAGDLNTSRFRPEFAGLLSLGFRDVHDALGKGLRPSFKLSNSGWLAKLGPIARLDHALTNRWLHPVEIEDLEAEGSDHIPFVVTIAVDDRTRPPGRHRFGRLHRRRSAMPVPEPNDGAAAGATAVREVSR